jgi:pimeloyl-ACP methyl ester carboxylesterase
LIPRFFRGCQSILGVLLHPLGRFTGALLNDLRTPERRERGLILVLPGIEGLSFVNQSIARGLADGGFEGAIEIHDWTTGVILLLLYHLRGWKRNMRQVDRLIRRISEYRRAYPGRPVYVVGHSGGGAMTVLTLERLPPEASVTGAVLLEPSISRSYDLSTALARTSRGIWSFSSWLDFLFEGIATSIAGTTDGRYGLAAGMIGFRLPAGLSESNQKLYQTQLHEISFRPGMIADFHFGGHFGPTNRVFVAERIAPLLKGTPT